MVILILGPFKLHMLHMICIDNDENSRPTPSPHEMVSNKIKIINLIIFVSLKNFWLKQTAYIQVAKSKRLNLGLN